MSGTIGALIESVHASFQEAKLSFGHGTDNAWDEAVALVLGVTGLPDDNQSLTEVVKPDQHAEIRNLVDRRISERMPLAYLLGRCTYMGLDFRVEPGVVIPRSPIGELLLGGVSPWLREPPSRVLDLCAGTGCLGILAAHLFPESEVVLLEIDERACRLARANIADHGFEDQVRLLQGDVTLPWPVSGRFDLIMANPPYVDEPDLRALPPEYLKEPESGLAGGHDGLSVITPILEQLPHFLGNRGVFVGEVGSSSPVLLRRFPALNPIWPDGLEAGEGVFLLEGAASSSHTARPRSG